jgi:L-iditol 2-dehydrogenase
VEGTMRAMYLTAPEQIELREQPIYQVGPNEVLVRVAYAGICPWDLRAYLGKKKVSLPRVLGHEISGTVVEKGELVKDLEIGDKVVGDFGVKCGYCVNCRQGRGNKCSNLEFLPGGFADYAKFPRTNIYPIKKGTSMKAAACTEPLATVFRGQRLLNLKPGEVEAVIGVGPIGQMHLQVARQFGARTIAVDLIQERLDLAKELGAEMTINSSETSMVDAIMEATGGRGADAITVTVQSAPLICEAVKALGYGGRLNIFAGIYPQDELHIDPNLIHYKELNILGSADSTSYEFREALKLIEDGAVKVEPLISHVLPLEELAKGLDIVAKCGGMKVIMEVEGD